METEKTIAQKWIQRLEDNSVEAMQNDVVGEVEAGGWGGYAYIFPDGSSVWQKRKNDWYPGDEYVQCPSCEEWREMPDDEDYVCDICDECDEAEVDDEVATGILKSEVSE
jgi:hypothetical protein